MRYLILALFLAAPPLHAWEFTPGAPCRVDHSLPGLDIALTHDPAVPEWTITLTREAPWPEVGFFRMAFANGIVITTDRQTLSDGGRTLSVADRGFGNVIAGLSSLPAAEARVGETAVRFSTEGAAAPLQKLTDCAPALGV